MGADGHIFVYDTDKLKELFPDLKSFIGYQARIYDHEIIICYTDYNYYDLHCPICSNDYCKEHEKILESCLVLKTEIWS